MLRICYKTRIIYSYARLSIKKHYKNWDTKNRGEPINSWDIKNKKLFQISKIIFNKICEKLVGRKNRIKKGDKD